MKKSKIILTTIFGVFMILAGIMHFYNPEMYNPFIPHWIPKLWVNYLSGILEIMLGVGVFIPQYRRIATLGIFILMVCFLPLHVIDVFRKYPAIGSQQMAYIRLPFQFLFIYWAWFIYKE